ncbi:hypothetical protein PCE1_000655 [Barthelona sp. PCE]
MDLTDKITEARVYIQSMMQQLEMAKGQPQEKVDFVHNNVNRELQRIPGLDQELLFRQARFFTKNLPPIDDVNDEEFFSIAQRALSTFFSVETRDIVKCESGINISNELDLSWRGSEFFIVPSNNNLINYSNVFALKMQYIALTQSFRHAILYLVFFPFLPNQKCVNCEKKFGGMAMDEYCQLNSDYLPYHTTC